MLRPAIVILAAAVCWRPAYDSNPVFGEVRDVPGLPRVLLIGDSISMGYTLPVRTRLAGRANVHRIPMNGGSSARGKQNLDAWLGDGKWDVIHFNFGLHDCFVEDGKHPVPLAEYESNLREIVARLKLTGARLVWASTTPIPGSVLLRPRDKPPVHDFYQEDVIAYNAAAKQIMDENGIAINDLYSFALPMLKQIQKSGDIHFTPMGYEALAKKVAQAIAQELERVHQRVP